MNPVSKVLAADDPWGKLDNPAMSDLTTWDGVLRKVSDVIGFAIPFAAGVAVVMIIVGGYSLMTSAGDAEKVEKGTKIITTAIIGMIVVFLTRLVIDFVLEGIIGSA